MPEFEDALEELKAHLRLQHPNAAARGDRLDYAGDLQTQRDPDYWQPRQAAETERPMRDTKGARGAWTAQAAQEGEVAPGVTWNPGTGRYEGSVAPQPQASTYERKGDRLDMPGWRVPTLPYALSDPNRGAHLGEQPLDAASDYYAGGLPRDNRPDNRSWSEIAGNTAAYAGNQAGLGAVAQFLSPLAMIPPGQAAANRGRWDEGAQRFAEDYPGVHAGVRAAGDVAMASGMPEGFGASSMAAAPRAGGLSDVAGRAVQDAPNTAGAFKMPSFFRGPKKTVAEEEAAGRGLSHIDDWQNEQWRQLENKDFHFDQVNPERIGAAIAAKPAPKRTFLEYQNDKLIRDVNATEQQMRDAGQSPAQIADVLNARFKMQATPEEVASGDNWWKTAKPIYKDDWTSKVPTIEEAQRLYAAPGGNATMDPRVKWTPERIKDFRSLADQGLSANQIADELSRKYGEAISGKAIGLQASARGIKTSGKPGLEAYIWTPERLKDFRDMAGQGKSAPQIADELSRKYGEDFSPLAVKSAAQRNQIALSGMKRWSPEEIEELRSLAAAGKSSFDAQMHFNEKYGLNVTRPALRSVAAYNGIKFAPNSKTQAGLSAFAPKMSGKPSE
jgi:hypothetical protein